MGLKTHEFFSHRRNFCLPVKHRPFVGSLCDFFVTFFFCEVFSSSAEDPAGEKVSHFYPIGACYVDMLCVQETHEPKKGTLSK